MTEDTWIVQFRLKRDMRFKKDDETWFDQAHIKTEIITWLEDLDFQVEALEVHTGAETASLKRQVERYRMIAPLFDPFCKHEDYSLCMDFCLLTPNELWMSFGDEWQKTLQKGAIDYLGAQAREDAWAWFEKINDWSPE